MVKDELYKQRMVALTQDQIDWLYNNHLKVSTTLRSLLTEYIKKYEDEVDISV